MNYSIKILKSAQKELSRINKKDQQTIITEIQKLADNPRPVNCKKLTGREAWRIRTGNYRIIYEINDTILTILVVTIGHRKDVYR